LDFALHYIPLILQNLLNNQDDPIAQKLSILVHGRLQQYSPVIRNQPIHDLWSALPQLLPVIRENVYYRHHAYVQLLLFIRGLLVPGRPELVNYFITDSVKQFLLANRDDPDLAVIGRTLHKSWPVCISLSLPIDV